MAEESKNNEQLNKINNANVNNRIAESISSEFGVVGGNNKKSSVNSDDARSLDGVLSNGSGSLNRRINSENHTFFHIK
jgi:hypothetical protein